MELNARNARDPIPFGWASFSVRRWPAQQKVNDFVSFDKSAGGKASYFFFSLSFVCSTMSTQSSSWPYQVVHVTHTNFSKWIHNGFCFFFISIGFNINYCITRAFFVCKKLAKIFQPIHIRIKLEENWMGTLEMKAREWVHRSQASIY